jgi:asparagine synthetase B (glutamine-hydrolysing)
MWLMAESQVNGIKMVLSGEGADELLRGTCFHKAPNAQISTKKPFVN